MTPAEAAELLAHAAAFDNRTVGSADAHAWAAALRDVPLDADTLAAVARFYGTPPPESGRQLWIQPHHVRTHRRDIRAARLEGFAYDPDRERDDDAARYVTRLRGQLDAVGSGRSPSPTQALALTGSAHKDAADALAGVVRTVPNADEKSEGDTPPWRRPGPHGTECPQCHAPVGRPCHLGDKQRPQPHQARVRAAIGEPPTDPEQATREEERRRAAAAARLAALTPEERQQLEEFRRRELGQNGGAR